MNWQEILKNIRQTLDLKYADIARATSTSISYVSEIGKGKSKNPKSEFIQALIKELNVNPYWLFLGNGPVIKAPDEQDMGIPKVQAQDALESLKQATKVLETYLQHQ